MQRIEQKGRRIERSYENKAKPEGGVRYAHATIDTQHKRSNFRSCHSNARWCPSSSITRVYAHQCTMLAHNFSYIHTHIHIHIHTYIYISHDFRYTQKKFSLNQTNLCIAIRSKKSFFDLKEFLDCFFSSNLRNGYLSSRISTYGM